jgi:hypothetical protein
MASNEVEKSGFRRKAGEAVPEFRECAGGELRRLMIALCRQAGSSTEFQAEA